MSEMIGWVLFLLVVGGGALLGLGRHARRRLMLLVSGGLVVMLAGVGLHGTVAHATSCPVRLPLTCAPRHTRTRVIPIPPAPTPSTRPAVLVDANPLFAGDFPDPFVLVAGDGYYAYATNTPLANVPVMYSRDLVHWTSRGDALPRLPSWAVSGKLTTWAPSVIEVDGIYRMYVTVGDTANQRECIAIASSTSPSGPFTLDPKSPLVCGESGAIDASPFRAADGGLWLVWKFEAGPSRPTSIVDQRLTGDGLSLAGSRTTLLVPTLGWEHGNVEGPCIVYRDGQYMLFYAAGDWKTGNYATGLARCSSPTGSYVKETRPVLSTSPNRVGPGGLTAFTAPDGALYAVFHTWRGGVGYQASGVRAFNVMRVSIPSTENGS